MELIVEFVLELFLEAGIEGIKSSRIPKFIRVILGLIITGIYAFLIFLLLFVSAKLIGTKDSLVGLFMLAVAVMLFVFVIKEVVVVYKKNKR